MHIALFIRSLAGSGAERTLADMANALAARGHKVDLVLGRAKGPFLKEVSPAVRIVDLKTITMVEAIPALMTRPGDLKALLPVLLDPKGPWVMGSVGRLARYLRAARPAVLLSALDYGNIAALCATDLSSAGTPVVIGQHCQFTQDVRNARKRRVRKLPPLVRRFYPRADAIIAVSDGVADDLSEATHIPRQRITTVYNPVVTPDLPARAQEPLDHPWFAPGAPPALIGVGKLKPQKDFPTLFRAFAQVRRVRPVRLLILGEGPERQRLEELATTLGIASDLDMPGFVANPFPYMARASAFVLSSAFEGLPSVLIQALACGCPVVSTDCPSGPAEILSNGAYGPLVPVGDPDALAKAVLAVLDNPPDRERLLARANAFNVDASVNDMLAVLQRAASREHAPNK
ncbi:glycosyltransferase [Virgifigura deserti]|uniref:glycosyltransferase n=1 Tax=Virgifigura deserti TaxID=2268457 RepID=UPI003CCBD6DC